MFGSVEVKDMKRIKYALPALMLLVVWCVGGIFRADEKNSDYRIVVMGDSIIGQVRDDTSVTGIMEGILQEKVFNGAFGGSNMSRMDHSRSLAFNADGLSMVALALAIGYDDFRVQRNVKLSIYGNGTEYFAKTLEALTSIDFRQVEVLFIEHGANDYNLGIPLSNEEAPYDEYTFGGALRTVLETLRGRFLRLRIVLVTPAYIWRTDMGLTCEEWFSGYGYLEDYVNLEIQIAGEYDIEVIDNYHDFLPNEEWDDWRLYSTDGLHLNEAGREKMARRLTDFLQGRDY
jgi:lysophospholipase L1-like esterase